MIKKTLKKIYRLTASVPARTTGWPVLAQKHILLDQATDDLYGYFPNLMPVVRLQRSEPDTLGQPLHWKFVPGALGLTEYTEPVAARLLPQVTLLGPAGTVLTRKLELVYDASLEICLLPETHSAFNRVVFGRPRRLEGLSLNLSASQAHENYFHWMTDALPKLALAYAAGFSLSDFDHFIVNSSSQHFQAESLLLLGIPADKIVALDEEPHLQCDRALVTTATCASGNVSPWIIDFLRAQFLTHAAPIVTPKKIFIARKHAVRRRLLNEQDVAALLQDQGFETVYPETMNFRQQLALFAGAEEIVAAHGAGLTNIAFCPPGTRVLELFPPSYINQGFWTMASLGQLKYAYLIGDGETVPDNHDLLRNTDFTIDVHELTKWLHR